MFKKIVDFFLIVFVLIYILFEELVWENIAKPSIKFITRIVSKFNFFEKFVIKIKELNSYTILVLFLVLFILVELLGIYSFMVFFQGKIFLAIFIYFLKLPLAAFILWFFTLTKDRLLEFKLFRFFYESMIFVISKIKEFRIYLLVKDKIYEIKKFINLKFKNSKSIIKAKILKIYQKLK